MDMEGLSAFMESSTIHGLTHISSSRKFVRLFWMLVVISGFIGSIVIIFQSFKAWDESPVKTTIETRSIKELNFPKVTVCPPKNTFTDLNFDLANVRGMILSNDTKKDLSNYAKELLYNDLYNSIKATLNILEDNDRYFNWYHGYTQLKLMKHVVQNSLSDTSPTSAYNIYTTASFGNISTQHFGKKFNANKVIRDIQIKIHVRPSYYDKDNPNITLHFELEKVELKALSLTGMDEYTVDLKDSLNTYGSDMKKRFINTEYTPPASTTNPTRGISLTRKVSIDDVRKQKLEEMPGFRFVWHYSGIKVDSYDQFTYLRTKSFKRNFPIMMALAKQELQLIN